MSMKPSLSKSKDRTGLKSYLKKAKVTSLKEHNEYYWDNYHSNSGTKKNSRHVKSKSGTVFKNVAPDIRKIAGYQSL